MPINAPPANPDDLPDQATAPQPRSVTTMGPPKALPPSRLGQVDKSNVQNPAAPTKGISAISGAAANRPDEEAKGSSQADNSKKRKAEGEARPSPEVATAVAGRSGKRRASPEADVS